MLGRSFCSRLSYNIITVEMWCKIDKAEYCTPCCITLNEKKLMYKMKVKRLYTFKAFNFTIKSGIYIVSFNGIVL